VKKEWNHEKDEVRKVKLMYASRFTPYAGIIQIRLKGLFSAA
tara:strand:+ start:324 stop:449 length:126 start_codon:yes stop_codon:yes gene_type:complete